jgi:hypothetical protein
MDYSIENNRGLSLCTDYRNIIRCIEPLQRNRVYADINGDMIKVFDEFIYDIDESYILSKIAYTKISLSQ